MPAIARTKRLLVRTWETTDADALSRLTHLPGISDFSLGGYKDWAPAQALDWIQQEARRFDERRLQKFAVVLSATGEIIGVSGLFPLPEPHQDSIELNYRYGRPWQGKGYATEAAQAVLHYGFAVLGLPRIHAVVREDNLPSQNVARKLGMTPAGTVTYLGTQAQLWAKDSDYNGN
jgi:RimJ/RimL family protein N-acetyltransferase